MKYMEERYWSILLKIISTPFPMLSAKIFFLIIIQPFFQQPLYGTETANEFAFLLFLHFGAENIATMLVRNKSV